MDTAPVLRLAQLVERHLGPCGRATVGMGARAQVLCKGAQVVKAVQAAHPSVLVVKQAVAAHQTAVGDGSTMFVVLAAELLRRGRTVAEESGLSMADVAERLGEACDRAVRALEGLAVDDADPVAICTTAVATKVKVARTAGVLGRLCARVALAKHVQIVPQYAVDPRLPEVVDGHFLQTQPVSKPRKPRLVEPRILVVHGAVEAAHLVSTAAIDVVIAGGAMDAATEQAARAAGILAVTNVSGANLVAVSRLLERSDGDGDSAPALHPGAGRCVAGKVRAVSVDATGIKIESSNSSVKTVVLRGLSAVDLDEQYVGACDAVAALRLGPGAVPGAGASEIAVAAQLRSGSVCEVAFGGALEQLVECLALSAATEVGRAAQAQARAAVRELRACTAPGMGVDMDNAGRPVNAGRAGIWDALQVKRRVWRGATDLACQLLVIDAVLVRQAAAE